MNSFAVLAFFAALAVANAGHLLGSSANVLQGPSSRTTLVGPEGSVISAVAPGGQVITEQHSGVVAHAAPVAHHAYAAPAVLAHSAYAAPIAHHGQVAHSAYASPIVAHHGLVGHSAYAAPVVAHHGLVGHSAGVLAHGGLDTVVAGPSGTIATRGSLGSPALLSHHVPSVYSHGVSAW